MKVFSQATNTVNKHTLTADTNEHKSIVITSRFVCPCMRVWGGGGGGGTGPLQSYSRKNDDFYVTQMNIYDGQTWTSCI